MSLKFTYESLSKRFGIAATWRDDIGGYRACVLTMGGDYFVRCSGCLGWDLWARDSYPPRQTIRSKKLDHLCADCDEWQPTHVLGRVCGRPEPIMDDEFVSGSTEIDEKDMTLIWGHTRSFQSLQSLRMWLYGREYMWGESNVYNPHIE